MAKTFIITIIIMVLATIPVFHHISITAESNAPSKEVALNSAVQKESKGNVHQTIKEDNTRKTDIHILVLIFIGFICILGFTITEDHFILRLPLYVVFFPAFSYVITWLLGVKYNIDIFILLGMFLFIKQYIGENYSSSIQKFINNLKIIKHEKN